jgi:hypothetical protein
MTVRTVSGQLGGALANDWAPEGLTIRLMVPLANPEGEPRSRGVTAEPYPKTSCTTPSRTTGVPSISIVVRSTGRSKCPAV